MNKPSLRASILFVVCTGLTAGAYQSSPVNRPWPYEVQKVPDESPVLSPTEAMKSFWMPPGYHVELVASEPLVQDPIAIDWDPDGRLWVVEYPEYVKDLEAPEPNLDPIGRSSCSRTPTTTARWTSGPCSPTVSCRHAR
jgi:hypothetical protein